MDEATPALLAAYPWLRATIWTQMNSRTRIAQIQKQLDEAMAMETAAMGEFRRYGTPYYEKEWSRAIEKSRELAEKLSRAEKQRTATAR
jgi:hypothetical protein